jgi:hypothetical protein
VYGSGWMKKWERDNGAVGHYPTFKIDCPFCKVSMAVRYSYVFPDGEPIYGMLGPCNQIAYKCPSCGYHQRFNIEDDYDYIKSLYDSRGKNHYSPVPNWEADERIRRQLESLGYWG